MKGAVSEKVKPRLVSPILFGEQTLNAKRRFRIICLLNSPFILLISSVFIMGLLQANGIRGDDTQVAVRMLGEIILFFLSAIGGLVSLCFAIYGLHQSLKEGEKLMLPMAGIIASLIPCSIILILVYRT